jgi:4'-phosphopantetheinyl transferase
MPETLASLMISNQDIHVWLASINQSDEDLYRLSRMLHKEESSKAAKYFFEVDKRRFIIRHGILREILSLYLGMAPQAISYHYGPYGKPYLCPQPSADTIQFSVSHSQGLVLFAFTRGRRIGIDLEYLTDIPEIDDIAKRWFGPSEVELLSNLPPDARQKAFFMYWTQKEAYLKARGEGLGLLSEAINLPLLFPGQKQPWFLQHHQPVSGWVCEILTPNPRYVAALVVEKIEYCLKWVQYRPAIDCAAQIANLH